jgi:hypothetical protein
MCAIDQAGNGLRGLIQDGCQGGRSKLKSIHGCHDMAKDTSAYVRRLSRGVSGAIANQ